MTETSDTFLLLISAQQRTDGYWRLSGHWIGLCLIPWRPDSNSEYSRLVLVYLKTFNCWHSEVHSTLHFTWRRKTSFKSQLGQFWYYQVRDSTPWRKSFQCTAPWTWAWPWTALDRHSLSLSLSLKNCPGLYQTQSTWLQQRVTWVSIFSSQCQRAQSGWFVMTFPLLSHIPVRWQVPLSLLLLLSLTVQGPEEPGRQLGPLYTSLERRHKPPGPPRIHLTHGLK